MRFAATFVLLTLGSVGGSAGVAGLAPAGSAVDRRIATDASDVLATLSDAAAQGHATEAFHWGVALAHQLTMRLPLPIGSRARRLGASAGARLWVATAMLPLLMAAMLVGVLAGLLRRHRLRERQGFASLTISFLGKQAVAVALAAYLFVALSPFAPLPWALYIALAIAAMGAAFYVGNLPPKL
jgi:hypothetical protein